MKAILLHYMSACKYKGSCTLACVILARVTYNYEQMWTFIVDSGFSSLLRDGWRCGAIPPYCVGFADKGLEIVLQLENVLPQN